VVVLCRNKATGRIAALQCKTACVGCKRCEKQCQTNSIVVTNGVAEIDETTCTRCGAEWFDRKTSERLDAALGEAAAALQARLVCEAIEHLTETMSQRDLEHLLGLSAGYLSKIRHGKERPSAQLVSLLALLATRPRRLGELERLWETGRLPLRITDDNLTRVEVGVDATDAVAL